MKTKILTLLSLVTVSTPFIASNLCSNKNLDKKQNDTVNSRFINFPANFIVNCQMQIGTGDNSAYLLGGKPTSYDKGFFNFLVIDNKGNVKYFLISVKQKQDEIYSFKKVTENSILVNTSSTFFIVNSISKTSFNADTIEPIANNQLPYEVILDFAKLYEQDIRKDGIILIDNNYKAYYASYLVAISGEAPLNVDGQLKCKTIANIANNCHLIGGENIAGNSSLYYLDFPGGDREVALDFNKNVNEIVSTKDGLNAYIATTNGIYKFSNDEGQQEVSAESLGADLMKNHPNANFSSLTIDEKNNLLYAFSNSSDTKDAGIFIIDLNNNSYKKMEAKEIGTSETIQQIFVNNFTQKIDIETFDQNKNNEAAFYFNVFLNEPFTPTPTPEVNNEKLSPATIAGIVVGSLAGVGLIVAGTFYLRKKNK